MRPSKRVSFLEGLRGCAALAVFISHFLLAFYPTVVRPVICDSTCGIFQSVITSLIAMLYDGGLAVRIFFIHSGFVLSYKFFSNPTDVSCLRHAALGRYFRLTIPISAAIFFAYLLMGLGLMVNQDVAPITRSEHWLGKLFNFDPSFMDAIAQSLWRSYFSFDEAYTYNTNLWTIRSELFGSFLTYAALFFVGKSVLRFPLYVLALGALNAHSDYVCFVFGIALCDLSHQMQILNARSTTPSIVIGLSLLTVGVCFSGYTQTTNAWSYDIMQLLSLPLYVNIQKSISAMFIVSSIFFLPRLQVFLALPLTQYLGRISFSLYLLHVPIIGSVGCGAFLFCDRHLELSYNGSVIVAATATLFVTFLMSHSMRRVVDEPSIRLARYIGASFDTRSE